MYERRDPIQILHHGRRYNGSYRLDGNVVHVESAYGSRAADLGRRSRPQIIAERLMHELVAAWAPAERRAD